MTCRVVDVQFLPARPGKDASMKISSAVVYSFSLNAEEPMAYLRLIAPLRQAGIELINGFEAGQSNLARLEGADVVVFQREFPTRFADYRKIVTLARQQGKPIVFELDDLLFSLPEIHPDRHEGHYYGPTLLPMFQALLEADLVTVTTPALAEALAAYNPNVIVLPNCLDEALWTLKPPARSDSAKTGLIIGYMGTNSHLPDLALIAPVLRELIEHYPEKIRFHFWGAPPPAELSALPQVQWTSQYFASYRDFAAFFQTQSADIFVAPLAENPFNRCKSPIKFFEYSALGAPGVYSRIEPYAGVITHGQNGLLAGSLAEWRASLIQLIEDEALRARLAAQAQATIKENWLLSQHAHRWQAAFQRAGEIALAGRPPETSIPKMADAINQQLSETFERQTALLQALRGQVAEYEQSTQRLSDQLEQSKVEAEQLKQEILGYALSKSWRWTRPVRAVGRRLKKLLGAAHV
jgi:glycosyltransferase involved in cell wall biosynthesis